MVQADLISIVALTPGLDGVQEAMISTVVHQAIAGCHQVARECLMVLRADSDTMEVIGAVGGARTTGITTADKIGEAMVELHPQDLVSFYFSLQFT